MKEEEEENNPQAFEIENHNDKGNFVRGTAQELKSIRSTRIRLCYCLIIFFSLKIILWGLKGTMINYVEKNYDMNEIKFIGLGIITAITNLFFFKVNGKIIKFAACLFLAFLLGGFFMFMYPVIRIIINNDLCPHLTTPGYCTQFRAFLICFTFFDTVGIFCVLSILKYSTKFADIKKKIREEPGKKEESKSAAGPFAPLDEEQDDQDKHEEEVASK